jgi:hypothetical protein
MYLRSYDKISRGAAGSNWCAQTYVRRIGDGRGGRHGCGCDGDSGLGTKVTEVEREQTAL